MAVSPNTRALPKSKAAILQIADHISTTKHMTEALSLAAETVGDGEGEALATLANLIYDRLEEACSLLGPHLAEARS